MMKKEWIYIAGLGLAVVIMSFTMLRDTSADCVAVAKYVTSGKGYLSNHEKQIASQITGVSTKYNYVGYYSRCLSIEQNLFPR